MIWRTKKGDVDLGRRALIMGVLNVTLDSFSDGGKYLAVSDAVEHGRRMLAEGADIIDVGGESTRPGAAPVPAEIERARVLPVIERLAALPGSLLSIDTSKAGVAREAVERGAAIINDVTGLRGDPEMAGVARDSGAGVIITHMQGTPRDMQISPHYENVVDEVGLFFRQSFALALRSGIDSMCIAFDPGIGFGKSAAHNLLLLRNLDRLRTEGRPLAVGVSRKSFLGKVIGSAAMADRLWPAVAATSYCREHGGSIFRVHDVKEHLEALRMTEAILEEA